MPGPVDSRAGSRGRAVAPLLAVLALAIVSVLAPITTGAADAATANRYAGEDRE